MADQTEIFYSIATPWQPASARGVRWNDPAFKIQWPLPDAAFLSPRDAEFADFAGADAAGNSP